MIGMISADGNDGDDDDDLSTDCTFQHEGAGEGHGSAEGGDEGGGAGGGVLQGTAGPPGGQVTNITNTIPIIIEIFIQFKQIFFFSI